MPDIGANSYGSKAGVASLVPRYADPTETDGWTASTDPTDTEVANWIDEVSALVNSMLSERGFDVPVTQDDVKKMLGMFVNEEVASIVLGTKGSGRFAPQSGDQAGKGSSRFGRIMKDFEGYLKRNRYGMIKLGVTSESDWASVDSSFESGDTPLISRDILDYDY